MIKEKLDALKIKEISKKINVPSATLYRWARGENIDNMVKFIEFLCLLEIDPIEYMKSKKIKE